MSFDLMAAIAEAAQPVTESVPLVKAAFYGEPGVGKTDLIASLEDSLKLLAPEYHQHLWPAVLIDIEGGKLTLKTRNRGIRTLRVMWWDMPDSKGEMFAKFKAFGLLQVFEFLKSGKHPFKSIGFDHLSEAQKLCMGSIMAQVVKEDPTRDPDVPSPREWGKMATQMTKMVRGFRDLPYNVFFAAWEKDKKQDDGVVKVSPSLQGSFADEFPGYLDEIWNMQAILDTKTNTTKRFMVTQPSQKVTAKSRTSLPRIIAEPNLTKIMAHILGFPLLPQEQAESAS
jgi:hypothetical protein